VSSLLSDSCLGLMYPHAANALHFLAILHVPLALPRALPASSVYDFIVGDSIPIGGLGFAVLAGLLTVGLVSLRGCLADLAGAFLSRLRLAFDLGGSLRSAVIFSGVSILRLLAVLSNPLASVLSAKAAGPRSPPW
jgi:hypothetical protein